MEDRTHLADGTLIKCATCGDFIVTDQDYINLRNARQRGRWDAHQVSALLRERSISQLPLFWLRDGMEPYGPLQREGLAPVDLQELLTRWPCTVAERLDRTLCNLARLSPAAGHILNVYMYEPSFAFATSRDEAKYHVRALVDYHFLEVEHKEMA